MKNLTPYLKNKFILATIILLVYTLFLDEDDIFSIFSKTKQLKELKIKQSDISSDLIEVRETLNKLDYITEIERYAREKKFFKKDNEDVFVIFSE